MKRLRQLSISFFVALLAGVCGSTSAIAENRDEVIFFFNDALGSAVAAVNESGELCWSEEYTGYGDKTINDDLVSPVGCGIVGEERGFTGHTEDVNSDLVYMQQRYYDPSIGRFLSIDPIDINPEVPTTYNRYAYANNNPYKYVDPDGRWAEDIFIGIPSVGIGAYSFGSNILSGNWGSAAVDLGGIIVDVGAILTPAAPGVAGLSIKASRLADTAKAAENVTDAPGGGKTIYHYTDEAGAEGILDSGVIKPDTKGRVYVTDDQISSAQANNTLFAGQGGAKGTHRVEIQLNQGTNLSRGTQPNEQIHIGSIRNGRQGNFEVKENDF